jgi:hypothetical protein
MRQISFKTLLLAGALAVSSGAALAQKPDKPVDYGQVPNSRESVKAEAREAARNSANTLVPGGEASTMTNHQPNQQQMPSEATRADVRQSAMVNTTRPRFNQPGERPAVPTNPAPATETGTPK